MESYEFVFTALKGRQANRPYYVVMCPLKLVPKIFVFDEVDLPPELRAQRNLNKARIPEIANYIKNNQSEYVFSSITASIDGSVKFEKFCIEGEMVEEIGKLRVPMDAKFVINDGQHRRAAIEEALKEFPDIGDETISVVFFIDSGLKRSQQMFADLNQHAVKPSKSLGILYDRRDPISILARDLVLKIEVFKNLTEMEKTSISNRSSKLFTLSSIYQGITSLLNHNGKSELTAQESELAKNFWSCVCENMKDWKLASRKEISTYELRRDYIHSHGLIIQCIGNLGRNLIGNGLSYRQELRKLNEIDWSRSNFSLWEGRALIGGKISKSRTCVILTTNKLKQYFGIELLPHEIKEEKIFLRKL